MSCDKNDRLQGVIKNRIISYFEATKMGTFHVYKMGIRFFTCAESAPEFIFNLLSTVSTRPPPFFNCNFKECESTSHCMSGSLNVFLFLVTVAPHHLDWIEKSMIRI